MDKEFNRPAQRVEHTIHEHCWHSEGETKLVAGLASGEYVCCHCGEHFAGQEAKLPIHSHGPFKPALP